MITIHAEPWAIDNHKIELRFRLDYIGQVFETVEVMEPDWFVEESIFERVVKNASGKLRYTYLKYVKENQMKEHRRIIK